MKKSFKILLCVFFAFAFCLKVNAECQDEELNEWATKVETVFKENTSTGIESSKYAYFLTITPQKGSHVDGDAKFRIVVIDETGARADGEVLTLSDGSKIYAVGCYTNLEEETYTIEVYGSENSACANEKLKTLRYTVPRFNRMVKNAKCVNNNSELCKTFTNSTKDMTEQEFEKEIDKYIEEQEEPMTTSEILKLALSYGLYIIIPLVIISLIYVFRVKKYKKEERKK